jgi:hypothetical protein
MPELRIRAGLTQDNLTNALTIVTRKLGDTEAKRASGHMGGMRFI